MLSTLEVKNFRNHRNLRLNSLGRINLIAGRNGAGKTSLLEAVWILGGPDTPELSERINSFRGATFQFSRKAFREIFFHFNHEQGAEIKAHGDWGTTPRTLHISLQRREQNQRVLQQEATKTEFAGSNIAWTESDDEIVFTYTHDDNSQYISRAWWYKQTVPSNSIGTAALTELGFRQQKQQVSDRPVSVLMASSFRENEQTVASRLGDLQLQGLDHDILKLLQPIEPQLKSLLTISLGEGSVVHASLQGIERPLPVRLVGEGFNRMLELALLIGSVRGGQLLVDEIENGLHHSVLQEVFSVLSEFAAEFDVQIFATTHSAECIDAAYQALKDKAEGEFAFFRLGRTENGTKAVRFDREMIETSIDHSLEIR